MGNDVTDNVPDGLFYEKKCGKTKIHDGVYAMDPQRSTIDLLTTLKADR